MRWCLAAYIATSAVRMSDDGSRRVVGQARDADRRVDVQRQLAEHERRDEQPAHASGQPFGVRDGAHVGQQDRELVATQPGDDVVVPQRAAQPLRDLLQQLVAAVVAERVVDVLEPVDVQEHEPDAGAGLLRLEDRAAHPLREHAPVGQARERVEEREPGVLQGGGLQPAGRGPHGPEQHHPEREQAERHDERQRADGLGERGARGGVVEHHLGGADHVGVLARRVGVERRRRPATGT